MQTQPKTTPSRLLFSASFGSGLEYYSYILFILLAKPLALNFFPGSNPDTGLLKTLAVFGIAYLANPIGAIIFGNLGDRTGRKIVFLTTILLMMAATCLIALLPNFSTIGLTSTLLLVFCRILQGIATGGEISGAAVMVAEHAPQGNRGLYCGTMFMGIGFGAAIATGTVGLLHILLSQTQINHWGWRLPFLLSIVLGMLGYSLRRGVQESPMFVWKNSSHQSAVWTLLRKSPFTVLSGLAIVLYGASLITLGLLLPHICHQQFGYPLHETFICLTVSFIGNAFLLPAFGRCSDYFGRKQFFCFTVIVSLFLIPLDFSLPLLQTFWALFLFIWIYHLCMTMIAAGYVPLLTELFPEKYRVSGFGLAYMSAFSIAGFVPVFCGWLLNLEHSIMPVLLLLSGVGVISLMGALSSNASTHA